jgi:myo-inositol-1(or 4)-monophosphatase
VVSDELKKNCKFAITEAGKIALNLQKKIKVKYKSKNQPVTNADIEINNFLLDFFKKKTPKFGWLSEESIDDKSRFDSDFFWCVDPIDGTRSYILGKPEYTISLALIKNFKPIYGIVYNPSTNEYFHAEENKGAFCNKKKIKVNTKRKFEFCSLAVSNSEINILKSYDFFNNKNVKKIGSIAYKIALVAKGKIDIAISFTKKNDWDTAAADLIIKEAHGTILETNGKKIIYNTQDLNINSIMAANDDIISDLKRKFNYS